MYFDVDLMIDLYTEAKAEMREAWDRVQTLNASIENFDVDPYDYEDAFCNLIDEDYETEHGKLRISGIAFTPSRVLRELDETAYWCSLTDYANTSFEGNPMDNDYYRELVEERDELDERLKIGGWDFSN
jgi:hypothetical protein